MTGDGLELTFQVNHLAPFLLTTRLLERTPPRRVVHVASLGQERPDFGDLMLEHGYDEWRAYRQSKLAQIMFSFECARRFPGVESVALHPATFMDTKMVRSRVGRPSNTVQTGADATVRLAAELDLDVQGRFFDGLEESRADELAYDPDARKRLWDVSEQLVDTRDRDHRRARVEQVVVTPVLTTLLERASSMGRSRASNWRARRGWTMRSCASGGGWLRRGGRRLRGREPLGLRRSETCSALSSMIRIAIRTSRITPGVDHVEQRDERRPDHQRGRPAGALSANAAARRTRRARITTSVIDVEHLDDAGRRTT